MGWDESGFLAAFARLLAVDSVTSTVLIKLATHPVRAISPVSGDEFFTPTRDRFNLLYGPALFHSL
jgi:hypothetical protein